MVEVFKQEFFEGIDIFLGFQGVEYLKNYQGL